jgi:UDP-N-acetylmuramoylalanine--D-glutamate ligase
MKIAILGFDVEGRAAYDYWNKPDNDITICDQDTGNQVPEVVESRLVDGYLNNLNEFDLIVRTPGLHPGKILEANAPGVLDKITSGTNEFLRVCPTKNVIGVTGTKGKGTTSTLITKMLKAAGKQVYLGGNIGIAPLDLLKENIQPDDYVVLELSNFQLIDLQTSPHIATCLMIVPEHLNWHADMQEYMTAKQQLFAHQNNSDIAIYYAENENSKIVSAAGDGQKIPFYAPPGATIDNGGISISGQEVCQTSEIKLLGEHNWQNACAAVTTVWQISQDIEAMRSVLTTFTGLEHRLEFVREFDGVKYYDDSFGTTPETAIVAIKAFAQPKVLILGGSDKGATYEELAETVKNNNVRSTILIGDTAPAIRDALEKVGFHNIQDGGITMSEMVAKMRTTAQQGDIGLLSTGCASFGLFKNYKDRGNQFKLKVNELS